MLLSRSSQSLCNQGSLSNKRIQYRDRKPYFSLNPFVTRVVFLTMRRKRVGDDIKYMSQSLCNQGSLSNHMGLETDSPHYWNVSIPL